MPGLKLTDPDPDRDDPAGNARHEYLRPGLKPCQRRCEGVSLKLPADHSREPEIVVELVDRHESRQFVNLSLAEALNLSRQLADRLAYAARLSNRTDGRRHDS